MQGFWAVYKREVKSHFQSPSTYIVLALFFFVLGWIFSATLQDFSRASQQAQMGGMMGQQQEAPNVTQAVIIPLFSVATSLVFFIIPLLSMRLIAEEKHSGTFELLVTCPISDWQILLGKYFGL